MEKFKFSKVLFLLTIAITTVCVSGNGYLGCYKEIFPVRFFNMNPGALGKSPLTPQSCYTLCGGLKFAYAALGMGRFCYCSNDTPDGKLEKDNNSTKCSLGCPGDPAQKCGSVAYISVYSTPIPVDLSVSAAPKVIPAGNNVVLTTEVDPSGLGFSAQIDFNDNAGTTEYAENGTNILQRTFYEAGEYEIRVLYTDVNQMLPNVETATSVLVESEPANVAILCPGVMPTYEEGSCIIEVTRGTNMQLELSYTDGNPGAAITESFPISDSMEYALGNSVQEHILSPVASGTSTAGLIIHQGNQAEFSGILIGIEIYGVNSGSLDVYVYRPSCGAQMYCYDTNLCDTTCDITCGVEGYCMDIDSCCGAPVARSMSLLTSYTLVHTVTVASVTPGYLYQSAPPGLDIQPGDVIAHDGMVSPLIASSAPNLPAGPPFDYYCAGFTAPASILSSNCAITTEVHQIKAIYAKNSEITFPLMFTMPGPVEFLAVASNLDTVNIGGSLTSTATISVLLGVNAAFLNVPVYVARNVLTDYSVDPYTGAPATVDWDFETNVFSGTDLQTVSHTYTDIGTFNVSVNISNAISYKVNFTQVYVEELITGLSVITPTNFVAAGALTNIDISMATGSNYTCDMDFSYEDGSVESVSKTETDGLNFDHTFSILGDITLNVNCSNHLGSVQTVHNFRAVEPLVNVALTPPGAVVGETFSFLLTWDTGTDITLDSFTYDGTPITMQVNETLRQAISVESRQESVTGIHNIAYQLTNPLGTESDPAAAFIIEVEITNAVITCVFPNESPAVAGSPYTIIPLNTGVECTVDMDLGTSVVIDVDYNDGITDQLSANTGETWASAEISFTFPITHTFTTAGYYQMTVTASNAFNFVTETFPIAVMVGVENSVMNGVSPVRFDPPAVLDFTFSITGPIPNDVTCYIEWGDGNDDEYTPCDLTATYNHVYLDRDGTLTLTYRLENLVSSKTDTIDVYIVTPIVNEECYTSKVAGIPDVPIDLVFKAWRAPSDTDLTLTFDCDTSVADVPTTRTRLGMSPDGEDTESCTYLTTGPVTMSIRAVSLMQDITCTHPFKILNPVTDEFDVYAPNAPIDHEFNPGCDLDYNILYTGSPYPDDAQITIDHGDNTTYGPVAFQASLDHQYSYASDGHYISKIRIFNDASEVTKNILTGCYAMFSATSLVVKRTPTLPLDSADTWGYGVNRDIFRSDEPVRIYPTFTEGTFVWWDVSAVSTDNIYTCNSTDRDVITMYIEEYGDYTITVTPKNPVHSGVPVTYTATVMRPVDNITVTELNQTRAYEDKYFDVSMMNYGTAMCVAVNFDMETNTVELYGDAVTCSDRTLAEPHFPGASFLTGLSTDVSQNFLLSHQYMTEGTFTLKMFAWNAISDADTEYQFAVSGLDCSAPNIDIRDRARDFRFPVAFQRSRRIKVTGITDIACPNTLNNKKNWTVFEKDQTTNTIIREIDVSDVPSRINSELAFDQLYLPYGVYLLKYKVTMLTASASGEEFSSKADTHIQVVPSDIVVNMFENSMSVLTVGPNVLFTFSPKSYSYDPDVDIAKGEVDIFDSFSMACRDMTLNETFPDLSVEVIPKNLTDLAPTHVDTGGCFQDGSGWFKNFDGSVTFWTSILKPDHQYELKVIGRKNAGSVVREATAFGQIDVKSANPPDFKMDFKIPLLLKTSTSGKLFNPNMQLGMLANLSTPCPDCTFLWELFAYDYQFCQTSECWRSLAYLDRYIEGNSGAQSEELTVRTEVFEHYKDVELFQLRLTVYDPNTGISGKRIMNLTRNSPPKGGNCDITPSNGTAMNTNFTVNCRDFVDKENHEITSYKIACKSSGAIKSVIHDTWPRWENKMLPVGDPNDGYILRCNVTVTDELGAEGSYPIQEVKVEAMAMGDYKQMLKDMTGSENDIVDILKAIANLEETSCFVSSMSSMMEEMSTDDENLVYAGLGTALSFMSTGLDSNATRTAAFTQAVTDPEQAREFEKERNNAALMIEQLAETLDSVTVESPQETEQLTSTIAAMSANKAFLTRATQTVLTDLLQKSLDNVLLNKDAMSVEEMKSVSQNVLDSCTNIGESAAQSGDMPTDSDLDTQDEAVKEFDTNLDTDLDDVGTFDNDEDVLRNGKTIYNKEVQDSFASGNNKKCSNIQDSLVDVLGEKQAKSPIPITLQSASFAAKIYKNNAKDLVNKTVAVGGCKVDIPSDLFAPEDADKTYSFAVTASVAPKVALPDHSPISKRSRTISVNIKSNGINTKVQNLKTPILLQIPQDPNAPKVNMSAIPLANPVIVKNRYEEVFFYHTTTVYNVRSAIYLQFRPTNISSDNQLLVLVNFDLKPEIDKTRQNIKHVCMIPSDTSLTGFYGSDSEEDPYTCFVDADIVGENTGIYSIAVRQLLPDELNLYKKKGDLPKTVPTAWKENKDFTTDYKFNPVELSCAYFDDGDSEAKTDGVKPSALSSESRLICQTNHLTTFGGGWVVAPNTIDWNFVFSNADFLKNPTLYVTEIVIVLAYIIAMIWSRRKDRQDLEKLGLAPLLDNDPRDKYYYEVMVSTGMRRGAGTESKVHFILSGEEEETDVRTFEDKKRKIFTRGSTDGFLMSVPEPLGALSYLRIWHDNSGKGRMASWYLNHVIVHDVQTDKKYYFIASKWFAVEEDDGQVDRVIPVAGKEQMTEFSHLFAERATKNLSDGHLWFSVVARPPQSRFTRCQRVSCCLCLLFTSMLANAMFYGTETSDSSAFQFGPFALTPEQIFIGIMANLIIFPVNFLLITLFRKSRPRKLRPSRVEEAIKSKPERTTSMADVNPRVKSSLDYERPGSSFLMETKRSQSQMSRPESSMSTANVGPAAGKKKKKKCELPWWFTIISWILLWIAVLVSAAFVTFYGIMFQDIKCKKWITSMLISFFTSVFLTQPIKVFLFAIFFSLVIKNPGADDEEDDDEEAPKKLETDEEYLHEEEDEFGFVSPRKPMYKPKPPDTKSLEAARKQRLKEIQMWSVIREILFYAFFLWILLVISYRSVSTNSYDYKHNMQKVFILTNDTNKAFSRVKDTNDFWSWAKSGMLRGLRAGPYYNDFPPFYMRGYINDKQSRLMGYAILRQTRTSPNTCRMPKYFDDVIEECNAGYDIADEEDRDFGVGWTPLPVNSTREEYQYRSASSLDSYPFWGQMALYGGGGYVVKLNKGYEDMITDFEQLESEGWIDKYTRSVFLEFTVYNPSINLFSVSSLLAEFLPSGGVITTFRFEPCNLLPYMNSALLFQVICEIVYFAFTVFFVFKEIRNIIKQKTEYFFQFWNLVDLGICAMSVTAIVIYFYRLICINKLTEYFNETNGNGYMKFQYVGYWSEIFNYIIGFLVFFATLKFLKLLRFNRKISMLSDTLRNSSKHLIHFSIIFNVVFLAFIQVFYLVYSSHLDIFKTFLSSCEAGIVMMMGKFDIYNMLGVNQWLTQVFIFLFVVTVTFIVVNMLLSILNDTFSAVRNDKAKQENDYEIVDFMLGRFKMWTGIGRGSTTISPTEMEQRNKNYRTLEGQIDYFPDQIDRFLASISNMYMGDVKFDAFLQKGMAQKMAMKAQAEQPGMSHPAPRHPGAVRISNGARGMTDVHTD